MPVSEGGVVEMYEKFPASHPLSIYFKKVGDLIVSAFSSSQSRLQHAITLFVHGDFVCLHPSPTLYIREASGQEHRWFQLEFSIPGLIQACLHVMGCWLCSPLKAHAHTSKWSLYSQHRIAWNIRLSTSPHPFPVINLFSCIVVNKDHYAVIRHDGFGGQKGSATHQYHHPCFWGGGVGATHLVVTPTFLFTAYEFCQHSWMTQHKSWWEV